MTDMSIMQSIRPKYCELIAQRRKTCEIRKTAPKIKPPFKVYIYMTQGKPELLMIERDGDEWYGMVYHGPTKFIKQPEGGYGWAHGKRGKVIGEYICDELAPIRFDKDGTPILHYAGPIKDWSACITAEEARKYCGNIEKKGLWAWHISEVVIYDRPKELKQFQIPTTYPARRMSGPPQSWCYVEEI